MVHPAGQPSSHQLLLLLIMHFIYNLSIRIYTLLIVLASPFNKKARLWVKGRKNWAVTLLNKIDPAQSYVWFHVSSLGEFEQGRPVIEAFREKHPELKIVLTFFSPSGYEIRKNYSGADIISYLPPDTTRNAKTFMKIVQPQAAFFVKYEFWYNYLNQLKKQHVPTYIFSAIFRPNQLFFKWYGAWYKKMLYLFNLLFVQNKTSEELLKQAGIEEVEIAGDTRFDRVFDIAQQAKNLPLIEEFINHTPVVIAGSSWPKDEELLIDFLNQTPLNVKLIIAPHEIHASNIQRLQKLIGDDSVLYSQARNGKISDKKVMIIDSIGLLSSVYRYADVAYIGGGFGKGIHNTLEAATFGKPVVFGPNYKKFNEAVELIQKNAGFSISNQDELNNIFRILLQNNEEKKRAGALALDYVNKMRGGTKKILEKAIIKNQ